MCQKCESTQASWEKIVKPMHLLVTADWVRVIAEIRHNSSGEVRKHETHEILERGEAYPSPFNWEENNNSCDCNRKLFFIRAVDPNYCASSVSDDEDDPLPCGEGEYSVRLVNPVTNVPYYAEF